LPACVSATGTSCASAKARNAPVARPYSTPPPATISGRFASRSIAEAWQIACSGGGLASNVTSAGEKKSSG
jgi:hypothetical protein